jgi:hypothetical protein
MVLIKVTTQEKLHQVLRTCNPLGNINHIKNATIYLGKFVMRKKLFKKSQHLNLESKEGALKC